MDQPSHRPNTRSNHAKRTRGDSGEYSSGGSPRKSPTRSQPSSASFVSSSSHLASEPLSPLSHPSQLFIAAEGDQPFDYYNLSSPTSSASHTASHLGGSSSKDAPSPGIVLANSMQPFALPSDEEALYQTNSHIASPSLVPSPSSHSTGFIHSPSGPSSSSGYHSQFHQQALSPQSMAQYQNTMSSPSSLSMTSSMQYTPALSSGTMSTSSSQDCFPSVAGIGSSTNSIGGQSPVVINPNTPQMMSGLGMIGPYFQSMPGQSMHKQTPSGGSTRVFINPPASIKSPPLNELHHHSGLTVGSNESQWGSRGMLESERMVSKSGRGVATSSSTDLVMAQPSRRGEDIGLELGDFDMLDTLGTGTFGRVILSQLRPSPSRPAQTQPHYFAMKVLEKVTVVRLRQVEHLNSERATLAHVSHPFIVNLFCTFQDEQNLYLLLEYVQGGELFSHLRRAGRFSADVARFYAANLILALEYLHKKDIIYRDLKPENLLIDSSGYLKITDFGFAKHVKDRTYTLCGTPEYLAPEIIMATGHGPAADWWALGVLIFELLAGYPPFFADNPLETYERILQNKFSFPAHIDRNARDLIRQLLTPDLSKRLGNLVDGASDVKRHPWFEGVDWDAVERKQIRAPIIPHASSPSDTSNFERYPPSSLETLPGVLRAAQARKYGIATELLPRADDPYGYLFQAF